MLINNKMVVIALLLLVCPGYGQKMFPDNYHDQLLIIENNTVKLISIVEGSAGQDSLVIYPHLVMINIITLYDEYEQECYNDSTLIPNFGGTFVYSKEKEEWSAVPVTPKYYHRDSTFKGFIEYLRKKVKK